MARAGEAPLQRRPDVGIFALQELVPGQPVEEECAGVRVVRVGQGLSPLCSLPVSCNPVWFTAIQKEVARWKPDLVIAREILLAQLLGLLLAPATRLVRVLNEPASAFARLLKAKGEKAEAEAPKTEAAAAPVAEAKAFQRPTT